MAEKFASKNWMDGWMINSLLHYQNMLVCVSVPGIYSSDTYVFLSLLISLLFYYPFDLRNSKWMAELYELKGSCVRYKQLGIWYNFNIP